MRTWFSLETRWIRENNENKPRHDKTNKVTVRPAKTQISLGIRPGLGIRPVWSEYSLCAPWVAKDPSFPCPEITFGLNSQGILWWDTFAVASSCKNRFPWKPGSIQVSVQPNNLREYFSAWFCFISYMNIWPKGKGRQPLGTIFLWKRKGFITSITGCMFQKNIFVLWIAHFSWFCTCIWPWQWQTTHWGQHFDVSRKASSLWLWSFVASLKKISSTSDFIR